MEPATSGGCGSAIATGALSIGASAIAASAVLKKKKGKEE
jgi:hypothetical protein